MNSKITLPNLLTGFRFVAAVGLLWLAWYGYGIAFMILLALAFLTDILDGLAARLTGQVSQFGAMLDSWADVVTYLTTAIGCWWLWPEVVYRELVFVVLMVASCLLPAVVGFIKFGCFTSYHTWGVKIAAACMGLSLYVLFFGGPVWPFRLASVICILAAIEEIALTVLLSESESNVRSFWDVLKRSDHNNP
jgi:CDP-diacylglycerol--glycerol-3-phosphate 3-phosphatidyltransferase